MFYSISDKIKKVASMIVVDDTPYESTIGGHKMIGEEQGDRCQDEEEKRTKRIEAPAITQVDQPVDKPTALPQQRRPRRRPDHRNKWNEETKSGLMKNYMQEYRADGRDKEVDGPNSTYKKKF